MALFVLVQSVHPAVHLPAGAGGGHCPLHLPLLCDQHEVPRPRPGLCQVKEFCQIFQTPLTPSVLPTLGQISRQVWE
jgi:hypothetical protein